MSEVLLIAVVGGFVVLAGFIIVLARHSGKDDKSHVRVGREWMTTAEYKKRYSPKSK